MRDPGEGRGVRRERHAVQPAGRGPSGEASTALFLSVLVVAELAAAFETSMILAGLKSLLQAFDRPIAVGWLVTSYLLVASAAAALGGRLGDLYGRSLVLKVSLGLAALGSLISALSPTLEGVIVGRAVQGLAGAILPLCLGLVRERMAPDRVGLGVGVVSATSAAGTGGGLVLGGLLVDHGHWALIFVASGAMALLGLLLAIWKLPRSLPKPMGARSLDILGGVLFAPAVAGVLLAIGNVRTFGVGDVRVWGLAAASCLLITVWARHELRHTDPLIDVRMLADPRIALANGCAALVAFSGASFPQLLILLVQQPVWTGVGLGATATLAGLVKLPGNVVSAVGAAATGHLCGRHGARAGFLIGAPIAAGGMFLLIKLNGDIWAVLLLSAMISLGVTIMYVAAPSLIVAVAPGARTSEAAGLMSVVRSLAHAAGSQAIVLMLAASALHDKSGVAVPAPNGFILALSVMGIVSLLPGLAALFFLRTGAPKSIGDHPTPQHAVEHEASR